MEKEHRNQQYVYQIKDVRIQAIIDRVIEETGYSFSEIMEKALYLQLLSPSWGELIEDHFSPECGVGVDSSWRWLFPEMFDSCSN